MSYYLMGDSGTVVFRPYTGVVESEDASYSNKVTSNPIEGGSTIDDHAVAEPVKVSISGMVISHSAAARATLIAMCRNRDLIAYKGENQYDNMLITSLSIGQSKTAGTGFTFKLTLQYMRLSASAFAPISAFAMSSEARTATPSGKKQKGTRQEQNVGLVTPSSAYADYVSSFNDPQPKNSGMAAARSNPSYRGY